MPPQKKASKVFTLPPIIADLVIARNRLREHCADVSLDFTLDGNLVGDTGEAVAAQLFGLTLSSRNGTGFDGSAPDGRTVQVKATGTKRGPPIRMIDYRAEHLLFLEFDLYELTGNVAFNGPEKIVLEFLPPCGTDSGALHPRRYACRYVGVGRGAPSSRR